MQRGLTKLVISHRYIVFPSIIFSILSFLLQDAIWSSFDFELIGILTTLHEDGVRLLVSIVLAINHLPSTIIYWGTFGMVWGQEASGGVGVLGNVGVDY
jgi:hypothetical protein